MNYYSVNGLVPSVVTVNLQGTSGFYSYKMQLLLGTGDRGQYYVDVLIMPPTGCVSYYFNAIIADGPVYRLPETGYYGTVHEGSNCHQNWLNTPTSVNFTVTTPVVTSILSPLFGKAQASDSFFSFTCPLGAFIFNMTTSATQYAANNAIRVQCSSGEVFTAGNWSAGCANFMPVCTTGYTGANVGVSDYYGVTAIIARCNGTSGTGTNSFDCLPGTVLTGIKGYADQAISGIRFACSPADPNLPPPPTTVPDNIRPFNFSCPRGTFISGVNGRSGIAVDSVTVKCSDGKTSFTAGGLGGCPVTNIAGCATGYAGADLWYLPNYVSQVSFYCGSLSVNDLGQFPFGVGNRRSSSRCPSGSKITGIFGTVGQYLVALNFTCANTTVSTTPVRPPDITNPYEFSCSNGSYIISINGRASTSVDRISVTCSNGNVFSTGGLGGDAVTGSDCPGGFTGASVAYRFPNTIQGTPVLNQQFVVKIVPSCNGISGTPIGSGSGGNPFNCPSGTYITGISGYSGLFVNKIHFVCGAMMPVSPMLGRPLYANSSFNFSCPDGGFLTTLGGRAGSSPTAVVVACSGGETFSVGGLEGDAYIVTPDCAAGYDGVQVAYDSNYVIQMRPNCEGFLGKSPPGQSLDFGVVSFRCSPGFKLSGIDGYLTQYLSAIRFTCGQPHPPPTLPDLYVSPIFGAVDSGNAQSSFFDFQCPEGEYILNFNGEAASSIVAVSVGCSGGGFYTTGGVGWNQVSNADCQAGFSGVYVAYSSVIPPRVPNFIFDYPHNIRQLLFSCSGSSTTPLGFSRFATGYAPTQQQLFSCPLGMRIVGISGSTNIYLNSISFTCVPGPFKPPPLSIPPPTLQSVSPLFGSPDGSWFSK